MSKVYTCEVRGPYGKSEIEVDTATGDREGDTLVCWLPAAGETKADARNVTFGAAGVDPEPAPEPEASTGPSAQQVADWLGEGDDATIRTLAEQHLPFVRATVHGYTRGRGFTDGVPADDLALVISASAARLVTNPALARSESVGDYSVNHAGFIGWTLPERAILNRYRKQAL